MKHKRITKTLSLLLTLTLLLCSCQTAHGSEKFEIRNEGIASNGFEKEKDNNKPEEKETGNINKQSNKAYEPLNYDEQKAIWFSYIDLAEFFSGNTKQEFKASIGLALDEVSKAGFNTVYIHVRAFEDAFYKKNNLEPNMVSEEVDMELIINAVFIFQCFFC